MIRWPVAIALLLLGSEALAQSLHVTGVMGNDVLMMRVYPSQQSGVVGVIPPYARGVVFLGRQEGPWSFVRYANAEGWVASRFLARDIPRGRMLAPSE